MNGAARTVLSGGDVDQSRPRKVPIGYRSMPSPPGNIPPLTTLAWVAIASCSAPGSIAEPPGEPFLRGTVESMMHRATASSLLVRPDSGPQGACGIRATVDVETLYFRRSEGRDLEPSDLAAVEVGDNVEVYVSGPIAESCPMQGYGSAIILIGP
jgi:hypothetical protein